VDDFKILSFLCLLKIGVFEHGAIHKLGNTHLEDFGTPSYSAFGRFLQTSGCAKSQAAS
jgi:hypothetical protein